jgi:hypothetical protein
LAQRYIIPIPNLELMDMEKPVKVEKKTIITMTKNVIHRKFGEDPDTFKNYLTINREENEELGSLNIKIPWYYKDPKSKLIELKNREKELVERMEFIKKLKLEFNAMNAEEKEKMSSIVALHAMNQMKSLKKEFELKIPPNISIIPIKDIEKEYESSLHKMIKKNRIHERIFPSFFSEISRISKEDIQDMFKEKKIQVEISFEEFKSLMDKGGIFNQTEVVQNLLKHIGSDSEGIEVLYDWVVHGRKKSTENVSLLKKLVKYSKNKHGMFEIEEYCLRRLKKDPRLEGEKVVLDFMKSLNETIQSEKYNPEEMELHEEYQQNQDIIRRGAYQFLKYAIKDQFNMDISVPSKLENESKKRGVYEMLVDKFQNQEHVPYFSQEELQFQFRPPEFYRSEIFSTTNQRRNQLFSEIKKK